MPTAVDNSPHYCSKCRKTMSGTNFYTLKSGEKSEMCKACETMHIDNYDPETFKWLLERYDVPYIPSEWNVLRDRAYQKDPYKMNGMSVFGKYIAKMKLKQWKEFTYADSERLQAEQEEKAKLYGQPHEITEQKIAQMKEAYENGEISEAQYKTYVEIEEPREPEFVQGPGGTITTAGPGNPYPINDNPFEKVDLPDVGADLTEEDKIYLATKWGRLYSAADWVTLESMYKDYEESFDLHNADLINGTKQLCKLDLKGNQALDSGDIDSYSKIARASDSLRKSLKFTEAQRKEEKNGAFDSVGQIVYYAEKEKGKIERYKITTPLDLADKAIENLKRYTHDLIMNDSTLAQQVENYLKRKENADSMKKDRAEAEARGDSIVEVKDEDYQEFQELIEKDREEDANELTEPT